MIDAFYRKFPSCLSFRGGVCKATALCALVFSSLLSVHGAVYYIDPAGSNSNNGTSTSTPWKDFTNVNALTLTPGDQVLLKRGGTWSQWLQIHGSGAAGNFITVGAYGTGSRPVIQRSSLPSNTNVADRCLTTYDASYLKIEHLEVCNAGAGIVIHYDNTYDHQSVYIDDVVAHDFYGIKFNAIPKGTGTGQDPTLPDNNYYFRGTNGWEGVTGAGHGPNYPTYWAPDHVATSAGIDVTGDWDHTTHGDSTMLNDFRVTNSEIYHCGTAVASDWQHWTDRDYFIATGDLGDGDRNKLTNFVFDNLYIHDVDAPWVSVGAVLLAVTNGGVIKNSYIYKGANFASGGTTIISNYNTNNTLIDNVTVKTVPVPDYTTTDESIMDLGGCYGLEIRNSTFENVAGYGFSFLLFSTGVNNGLNFHDNTFINVDWHWKNIIEVFHTIGSDPNNKPAGSINTNYLTYVPDETLTDTSGRWTATTFYANDEIQNINRGVDLAKGKTTTASSVYGSGYEASKATDGNESTYWASPYTNTTPQWLQIDLGAVYPFNEIQSWWVGNSYAVKYEDQVSLDGVAWETVINRDLAYNLTVTDDTFTLRKARYVRILMTAGNTAGHNPPNFGLYRVHVYNSENFAQGAPATASSTTTTAARSTADYGNDGNDASMWTSDVASGSAWYKVDLGQTYNVNEVCTNWGGSFAKSYTVQVSTDDSTYTTVKTVTGVTTPGITRDVFPRIGARYVKLVMTQGHVADPTDYSIREMRVYSARNAAQDQVCSASSTTTTLGYDAWRALDPSNNTRWSSAVASGPCWYKVDLGQTLQMNEFITKWETAYAKDYTIQTSLDDSTYTTRVTRTGVASAGTTVDKVSAVSARYVKINMTQGYRADPTNYSIKTFEVNYDMARGRACTASSTNASYPLANAVDTDDTTRWSSNVASGTQWFKVNLGGTHTIDRVMIDWDTAYGKDYTIAVSTDDVNYTTVATRAGIRSAGTTDDKLDVAVAGQYVKITMTKGYVADPTNYSINNISVYGTHP